MTDKYLTVKELKKLLEKLEDDLIVKPNEVGNLMILSKYNVYLGYVDLLQGTLELR